MGNFYKYEETKKILATVIYDEKFPLSDNELKEISYSDNVNFKITMEKRYESVANHYRHNPAFHKKIDRVADIIMELFSDDGPGGAGWPG